MKITDVSFPKVSIPFEAAADQVGGVSHAWKQIVIRMQTDDGIEGIGEACGGDATLIQLHALKSYVVGEDPFDREKILKTPLYVPTYHGISGKYTIQGLATC